MNNKPEWYNKLISLNISEEIKKEFGNRKYSYTENLNEINKIFQIFSNLIIIKKDDLKAFIKNNENLDFEFCASSVLLNNIDDIYKGLSKLENTYKDEKNLHKNGLLNEIEKTSIDFLFAPNYFNNKNRDGSKIYNNGSHYYYVIGKNLSLSISDIIKNKNKNSELMFFTYNKNLEIFIFFPETYSETIKEIEKNLTFNEFIENNNSLLNEDNNEFEECGLSNINYIKPKKFLFF